MKRLLLILLGIFLLLSGCTPPYNNKTPEPMTPEQTPLQDTHLKFAAQYIRTDGYDESRQYPIVTMITDKGALQAYYDAHKNEYNLGAFEHAAAAYDDAFFADHCLALVVLEETSGSVSHEVEDVVFDGAAVRIEIERHFPQIGTADMAQWHIFVELPAKVSDAALSVTTRDIRQSFQ